MKLDCCCKTIAPHCPACHSVGGHGMDFALLVIGHRGELVTATTDVVDAVDAARVAHGYVCVAPILVDYRDHEDRADAPAIGTASVPSSPDPDQADRAWLDAVLPRREPLLSLVEPQSRRADAPIFDFVCSACGSPWRLDGCLTGCEGAVGIPRAAPRLSAPSEPLSGPHDGFPAGGRTAYSPNGWRSDREGVVGTMTTPGDRP